MLKSYWLKGLNCSIWSLVILLTTLNLAWSQTNTCPADLQNLTPLLLKDLPDYSNRVIQRTQKLHRDRNIYRYIITAGKAELEPLNLPQIQYNSGDSQPPKQVFFTVLEREYSNNQKTEIQTYHWLFLTPTANGWQLVTMFSRFGDSSEITRRSAFRGLLETTPTQNTPPTPPKETSNGIIGRGIQLWLRDCQAGRI
ncbi:MAG: hypothetical protein ACFCU5_09515 [Pleurocapsa sp.]